MTTLRSGLRACSVNDFGARPIFEFDERGVEAHAVRGRIDVGAGVFEESPWPRRAGCRCRFPSERSARPDGSIRVRRARRDRRARSASAAVATRRGRRGRRARPRAGGGAGVPRSAIHSTWRVPRLRSLSRRECSRPMRRSAMRENGIATCLFPQGRGPLVTWPHAIGGIARRRRRPRAPGRRRSARSARSGTARPPRCSGPRGGW